MRLRSVFRAKNLSVAVMKAPHCARLELLVRRLEIHLADLRQKRLGNHALDHGIVDVGLGIGVADELLLQQVDVDTERAKPGDSLAETVVHSGTEGVLVQARSVLAPQEIGFTAERHVVADEYTATGYQFDSHALVVGGTQPQGKGKVVAGLMLQNESGEELGSNERLAIQLAILDCKFAVHDAETPVGEVLFNEVDQVAVSNGHKRNGARRRRNVDEVATGNFDCPTVGAESCGCG